MLTSRPRHSTPNSMLIGKPSENRFRVGEMRFNRPNEPCTISITKAVGREISRAEEISQPRLWPKVCNEGTVMAWPMGQ
ncbi:hypothetical protein D3C79_1056040 [compost metagenome]